MCMHLCFFCGWQGIWRHLDVCTCMQSLPFIVAYVFLTYHPFSMSSLATQSCLGCNWIFQFAPCAPHHSHPNCFHPTMGVHLLCLESITHHYLQFGPKGFELLFPSMVQASFSLTNSRKFGPPWNCFPQARHLYAPMHLVLLLIKDIKPLPQILHSNHSGNPLEFWSSMYCKEPSSSAKKLYSMTCLYFSRLVLCLFTKALSRYAIVCSMKNVMTIS